MKLLLISLVLLVSCTDILVQDDNYYSIYLNGDAWVELNRTDDFINNTFTIEVWVSGEFTQELQTLLSIIDSDENIIFGLFSDTINESILQVRMNNEIVDLIELENSFYTGFFHYLTIVSENATRTTIYIDGINVANIETSIDLNNNSITIGGKVNKSHTISENFWHGYIDEARIWNSTLDNFINEDGTLINVVDFHNEYYYKISESSEDEYLNNLFGLWRFNNSGNNYSYIIQDQTCATINTLYSDYPCTIDNDGIIYTTGNGRVEFSTNHK